jgi:1,4-dihydroxy-2-naphthoyl-CoA synthase
MVSELFDPAAWQSVPGFAFTDITYHRAIDQGTVRIAFHRPEVRNAFRPRTVDELYTALDHARMSTDVGCILLHVVCDLTIASREHAIFKQTDTDVASFDGGFGSAYLARQVGQKRAREIFFLGLDYSADDALAMGAVNAVVPHAELETFALSWAKEVNAKSPTAQRMVKFALNAIDDGLIGQQVFAGEATRLAYMTDEAQEGRDSFLEKRDPDWSRFPYHY